MKKDSGKAVERRSDGMPIGTPFKKGQSGNPEGMKPGTLHLSTRVRRLLSGEEKLPDAIAETIRNAVGDDRQALDAMVIVGLLQALQGDEKWAKLLWEYGFGKVPDKQEITGEDGGPIATRGELVITLVPAKGSSDE